MESTQNRTTAADALVIFGAIGDLAHKLIFRALYAMARRGVIYVPVIGIDSSNWSVRTSANAAPIALIKGLLSIVKHPTTLEKIMLR